MALVSGIGHLSVFTRYAVVDEIWRGTMKLAHYWAAAMLFMLGAYALLIWLFFGRARYRLTSFGRLRLCLLAAVALTGLPLLLHNLPGFSLYGAAYAIVKLGHLACAVAVVALSLMRLGACLVKDCPYIVPRGKRSQGRYHSPRGLRP